MKQETRLKVGPVAVLVLLALLLLLAVHRNGLTTKEAEDETVGTVISVKDRAERDRHVAVVVISLIALFAFLMWAALRANKGDDKAMPPANEPSTSDRTTSR
jgi:hypothetical protein